MQQTYFFHKMV